MRLEMREVKSENSDDVFFELLNETTNEWEKLPFVVGAYIRETMPDIDTSFNFSCTNCGLERKEDTTMGVSFFWPNG